MTSSGQEYSYSSNGRGGAGAGWLERAEAFPSSSRRRKFAGYLKAANDLRQSYQGTAVQAWHDRNAGFEYDDTSGEGIPGSFPDAVSVQNGDDQMIIFPSYARRHIKRKPKAMPGTIQQASGEGRDVRDSTGTGDAQFWQREWEKYEDDHAVVDVDVRGWIYAPHKGAMNRKQRLFISLARQLAGLPNASARNASGSPARRSIMGRMEAKSSMQDDERVAREAENILRKGEAEADVAARGGYSEEPGRDSDTDSLMSPRGRSSVASQRRPSGLSSQVTTSDTITPLQKREMWNQPVDMSPSELTVANAHLMARLRPFLANPLANIAISAFFYNDDHSQQKTIYTDAYGHFSIRAALDFVPTHVRILASEDLSVTEEVIVTETSGVSLISDIDDTIKHSAIGSGAREIFRNAFIRDLGDLTIDGVKDWYSHLSQLGVKFHYVSNSPWQIYPVLTKFFALAGLPPGSFHLKQYSGMLQGIFEPVAERKKLTLDKLARDFPERSFILVGDSGEADLEVYTDFVLENPGRVLGIFIRDVTTTPSKGFFTSSDPSSANNSPKGSLAGSPRRTPRATPPNRSPRLGPTRSYTNERTARHNLAQSSVAAERDGDDPELQAAIRASLEDLEKQQSHEASRVTARRLLAGGPVHASGVSERRPNLPPRRSDPGAAQIHQMEQPEEDLIDLSDAAESSPELFKPLQPVRSLPTATHSPPVAKKPARLSVSTRKHTPPIPPKKAMSLQGGASQEHLRSLSPPQTNEREGLKTPPPKPQRPSSSVRTPSFQNSDPPTPGSRMPAPQSSVTSAIGQKLSTAYNALPSVSGRFYGDQQVNGNTSATAGKPPPSPQAQSHPEKKQAPPPPPPRRALTSYPIAAANYAGNRLSGLYNYNEPSPSSAQNQPYSTETSGSTSSINRTSTTDNPSPRTNDMTRNGNPRNDYWEQQPQLSKKEALWRDRWRHASNVMREKGIVLRSWRVGEDVEAEAVRLVEEALKRGNKGTDIKRRK